MELDISERSIRRILKSDLGLHFYKNVIEPALSYDQKIKRKQFANSIRTDFRKHETSKILFSDEKFFDIDGVYKSQNDRVRAVDRADVDEKDGFKQKGKIPQKVMVCTVKKKGRIKNVATSYEPFFRMWNCQEPLKRFLK